MAVGPSRLEVEIQLEKILESKSFSGGISGRRVDVLGRLLTFIVLRTLGGIPPTENDILYDFFEMAGTDTGQRDNGRARTYANRLRSKLSKYQHETGVEDLVRIAIPTGAYKAEFSYRSSSPAARHVALGFQHIDKETPLDAIAALKHFEDAIALAPNYSEGYAGKASALIVRALYVWHSDPIELLQHAEAACRRAIALNERSWRGYVNLGYLQLSNHRWRDADEAFAQALEIAPGEIETMAVFGRYLISRNRHDEAQALAERYASTGFDKPVLLARAGLYFYVLRQYEKAREVLQKAFNLDQHFWLTNMTRAFLFLALNDTERACVYFESAKELSDGLWPGLEVICLEYDGCSDAANASFRELKYQASYDYIEPIQLALAHLGVGKMRESIHYLDKACEIGDPNTIWLHCWPILDPLRGYREFGELLRKWKFPVS